MDLLCVFKLILLFALIAFIMLLIVSHFEGSIEDGRLQIINDFKTNNNVMNASTSLS